MTLRKKKAEEQIAAQIFLNSVKCQELAWNVVRREQKKTLANLIERQLEGPTVERQLIINTELQRKVQLPDKLMRLLTVIKQRFQPSAETTCENSKLKRRHSQTFEEEGISSMSDAESPLKQ
jgi:hypothetical protein